MVEKILITSTGRTATRSLADFCNAIEGVVCYHEKHRNDVQLLFISQLPQYSTLVKEYLTKRMSEMDKAAGSHFVEVNPYFRFVDNDLLKGMGWKKIGIIRHPKTYLESVFERPLFTKYDVLLNQFPSNSDPASEKWTHWSRFQKLCWYYASANNFLLQSEIPMFQFEKLVNQDAQVKELLTLMNIDITNVSNFNLPKRNSSARFSSTKQLKQLFGNDTFRPEQLDWETLSAAEKQTYTEYCQPIIKQVYGDI